MKRRVADPPQVSPTMTRLATAISRCRRCPTMAQSVPAASFDGSARSRVMFIGEAPGRHGAGRTGVPFHGDATGRNFETLLAAARWNRTDVWVTNAVMCCPTSDAGNNRPPSTREIDSCSDFLRKQIAAIDPLVVVPLGATALRALSRLSPLPRERLRVLVGRPYPWLGRTVVPLFHPSPRVINAIRSTKQQSHDYRRLRRLVDALVGDERFRPDLATGG